jgi:hypothetical protein
VVEAQNAVQQGRQEVKTKDGNDDAETEEEELAATSPIRLVTCRVPHTRDVRARVLDRDRDQLLSP